MTSKTFLISIFLVGLATLISGDGSLKVGDFTSNAKLLYRGNFDAIGIFFLKRTETFDIKLTNGGKIKAIDILDLRGDSTSWILAGGVDEDFATIKLESRRGSGYNFVIEVYGYDDENEETPAAPNEEYPNKEDSKEEGANNEGDKEDKPEYTEPEYLPGARPEENYGEDNKVEGAGEEKNEENKPEGSYGDNPEGSYGDKPEESYNDEPKESYGDKPEESFGDKPEETLGDNEPEKASNENKPEESFGDNQ